MQGMRWKAEKEESCRGDGEWREGNRGQKRDVGSILKIGMRKKRN